MKHFFYENYQGLLFFAFLFILFCPSDFFHFFSFHFFFFGYFRKINTFSDVFFCFFIYVLKYIILNIISYRSSIFDFLSTYTCETQNEPEMKTQGLSVCYMQIKNSNLDLNQTKTGQYYF